MSQETRDALDAMIDGLAKCQVALDADTVNAITRVAFSIGEYAWNANYTDRLEYEYQEDGDGIYFIRELKEYYVTIIESRQVRVKAINGGMALEIARRDLPSGEVFETEVDDAYLADV